MSAKLATGESNAKTVRPTTQYYIKFEFNEVILVKVIARPRVRLMF